MKHFDIMTFLRKTTISRRLLFLFLIQTAFIFLWCIFIVRNSMEEYENTIRLHNSKLISSLSHNIEQSVKEVKMATKLPILQSARGTSQIFKILSNKGEEELGYGELYSMEKNIFDILEAYNQASVIAISDLEGSVIYGIKDTPNYHISSLDMNSALFRNAINSKGGLLILPSDQVYLPRVITPTHCIWGVRSIMHINPFRPIGIIFVCMNITNAIEEFQIGSFYEGQTVGIFDSKGTLLLGDLTEEVYEALREKSGEQQTGNLYMTRMRLGNSDDIYHYVKTESGLLVTTKTPYSHIIADVSRQQIGLYFLLFFLIISIIVITRLLVKSINQPVHTLVEACNAMSDKNAGMKIDDNARDEIHALIVSFNSMSEKIHFLIQEVYQKDMLQAQTELQMLRSQINPHFIYNTLETIRSSALSSGNHKLEQMASLFGKTLRYGVSSPSEPVTLAQEIANLYDYINLQNMHFQGLLNFYVNVEEELRDCIVIKLLLQPLVENSIYHGFSTTESPGIIDILGFTDGQTLTFKVTDNGIGIDKDTLMLLNEYINNENDYFTSIGLKNVNRRIKLYYGESYGMYLESTFGRGTVITVNIPYRKAE